ncbi:hypothetical protein J4E80_004655 [Alternaria sp. BMP 0032]|nr:hypothetical protein J4E80_004655 [Alternaria sp. BMP 0032]
MAEVAGTIVGVISLSLQLYDKLSEYRNGVKNAKKKGEQITRELDTLVNLSKASAAVDENPSHLYLLMTRMGWVRGCQILLDAGYSYTPEGRHHLPLLIEAIDSKNPSMVQFWLNTRENAAVEGLAYIGRLEYAVVYALRVSEANIGKLLVTHLVEQRRQLRQMIGSSGIECECVRTPEVVLDAHATCAMDVLDEHNLKILQFLYDAGFKDIAGNDIKCSKNVPWSPFHFGIVSYKGPDHDELHRIQEEDAVLVTVLEELVPSFDARYDAHESDLQSFINDVVTPEINIVLDQLKQEDEAANAAGRREMGVVMIEESKNSVIEECESDSLDECESDVVDECESDAYEED